MNEQATPNQALGMIEVYGRIGAIEALDAALKAANVRFVNMSKVGGGLTAVFVEGEVGAVKASVEAGGAAADRVSKLISVHVIPRPAEHIRSLTGELTLPETSVLEKKVSEEKDDEKTEQTVEIKNTEEKTVLPSFEDVQGYNVSKLRSLARSIEDFPMKRKDITFAKRDEIMEILKKYLERGNK